MPGTDEQPSNRLIQVAADVAHLRDLMDQSFKYIREEVGELRVLVDRIGQQVPSRGELGLLTDKVMDLCNRVANLERDQMNYKAMTELKLAEINKDRQILSWLLAVATAIITSLVIAFLVGWLKLA